jgi:hypothetical protein
MRASILFDAVMWNVAIFTWLVCTSGAVGAMVAT